jgi:hypothetical protein
LKATIPEIVRRAGGARNSGVTRNLILFNPVSATFTPRGMTVTITVVAKEGERKGHVLTRELAEWKPVEQIEFPPEQ